MIEIKDIKHCGGVSTVVIVEEGGASPEGSSTIEMRSNGTHIQYRPVGGGDWTNIIAVSALIGPEGAPGVAGPSIELQKTDTHVQWRVVGGLWADLVALSEITGPAGAPGSPGSGSSISNPHVIYVRSDGDDPTGEIGNPGMPFQTADAAYDAGVASAAPFSLNLGVGSFTITKPQLSTYFRGASGVPGSTYGTCLTVLTVNATAPTAIDDNASSSNGAALGIDHIEIYLTVDGGSVTGADPGSYSAGTGGSVYLSGTATCRVAVSSRGGQNSSGMNGGSGGTINLVGPMFMLAVDVSGDSGGSNGYLDAFGVDFRNMSMSHGTNRLAGCAYLTGTMGSFSDMGGNSAW